MISGDDPKPWKLLAGGTIVGVERAENLALIGGLHILDDRDGIVGVEFGRDIGDFAGGERIDQILTDIIVHLGEHFAVEQIGNRLGERGARVGREQFEQIGNVGRVERFDQGARAFGHAVIHRIEHGADEFGLQPVILIELCRLGCGFGKFGLAHDGPPCPCRSCPCPRAV